jgi:Leucine-rich repeat (LRR) protein
VIVGKPESPESKPAARNKWLIGAGVGACGLLLVLMGLWAGGVFKVKTKDGTIVLENLPADTDVLVDGDTVTLKWGDAKTAEVRVAPGKKHRIQVKKEGFKVFGDEVEVDVGGSKAVLVHLESNDPSRPPADVWLKEVAALPVHKQADAVATKLKELNPGFDGKIEYKVERGQVVSLEFSTVSVKDISPVRALPGLQVLVCAGNWWARNGQLGDLTPLKGMKLTELYCHDTQVADLSPLRGMPLTNLECFDTKVSDLSPLKDMKLMALSCSNTKVSDLSPLKDMKLTALYCSGTPVSDLSPLKDMKLTTLNCGGTPVSDLSPLKDMNLTWLNCGGTRVSDLSPLKDMKLTYLHCENTRVSDLSPLKDMRLTDVDCDNTRVSDLSPLKDMNLRWLNCARTRVSDLSPLKGMPLKEVYCDFKPERDAEILRSIKTLERINEKPAAQFWKELPPAKPDGQGFVPLFNGKDLDGWDYEDPRYKDHWSVDKGERAITVKGARPGTRNWLLSKKEYANFVLRFEYLTMKEDTASAVAYRCEVGETARDPNPERAGQRISFHPNCTLVSESAGWVPFIMRAPSAPVDSSMIGATKPVGEWNDVEMSLSGPRLRIQINDRVVHDVDLHEIAEMTDPSSFEGYKRAKGHIGFLSLFQNEVQFRNIRIKELPTGPKGQDSPRTGPVQSTIPPAGKGRVVATWYIRAGTNPGGIHTLYSNGRLDRTNGSDTWDLTGKVVRFRWTNPRAPGGVWVDVCTLSDDGKTFRGTNQIRVPISGVKISGDDLTKATATRP